MKVLVGTGVFGLIPVPPMPVDASSSCDHRPTMAEEVNPPRLVLRPHGKGKSMRAMLTAALVGLGLIGIAVTFLLVPPSHAIDQAIASKPVTERERVCAASGIGLECLPF
jgi:hypothetical protein